MVTNLILYKILVINALGNISFLIETDPVKQKESDKGSKFITFFSFRQQNFYNDFLNCESYKMIHFISKWLYSP